MPKEPKKKIRSSLLAAAIVVFIVGMPGSGFMVFLVALPLLVWIPCSVYVMITKPEMRTNQLIRVGIWVLVVPLLYGIHYFRQVTTRRNADEIVAEVNGFSRMHGRYPLTLDEIGISRKKLKEKLGFSGYLIYTGKPRLWYHTTMTPFGMCDYHFETGSWICRPD
ncbi:MAG: hypothetical protein WCA09_05600 [Burkholderiales bacterium]